MVYFIQHEESGPIKIGSSAHLSARLKHHEKTKGIAAILGVHDGDRTVERAVHRRFAHLKIAKIRRMVGKNSLELFQPAPELLVYIADNCRQAEVGENRPVNQSVRLDLAPVVHKALRREAAELDTSMSALARRIVSERYGFNEDGEKK